jgi:hypothetical protein
MIPREIAIALAKLENEKIFVHDQYLAELAKVTKDLQLKYAPRMAAIKEAIDQHKAKVAQHVSLTEEIHWRIYDRQNHTTSMETTKKMKRGFKREAKRRNRYAS